MLTRRNWLLRLSVVLNVAVLFYFGSYLTIRYVLNNCYVRARFRQFSDGYFGNGEAGKVTFPHFGRIGPSDSAAPRRYENKLFVHIRCWYDALAILRRLRRPRVHFPTGIVIVLSILLCTFYTIKY